MTNGIQICNYSIGDLVGLQTPDGIVVAIINGINPFKVIWGDVEMTFTDKSSLILNMHVQKAAVLKSAGILIGKRSNHKRN